MSKPSESPIAFAVPDVDDSDIAAVEAVLRSGWITTGEVCAALEADLAARLGAPHVVAVSSCTAALQIAYASLGLPPGARVGVPTWTFVASAMACVHEGAVPVLLDIDPGTLNVSADSLAAALREGLDALVVVHFGGVSVGEEVLDLAEAAGVPVIEDAAHALGTSDHRGPVSGVGTVGACLSFYATKNLTSAEGGALVTHDEALDDFARSYRLHGLSRDAEARYRPGGMAQYDLVAPGIKANLPDVLAALARSQLVRFDAMQARRREIVLAYRIALADVDDLRFVPSTLDPHGADHLAVVVLPARVDRDEVVAALGAAGIGTSVHFHPLHRFEWFRDHGAIGPTGVTVAESIAERVLSLPLHCRLSDQEISRACDVLRAALS